MGRAVQDNCEKNVKCSSCFRKSKFKEIKKLNSYITTYVQKIPPPLPYLPRRYSPSTKISEKTSRLELQQFEIHQHPPNFWEGPHTMYHCIPPRKPEQALFQLHLQTGECDLNNS